MNNQESPPFLLEESFYPQAETLRHQFETVSRSLDICGQATPFAYAFCKNAYQLLTARPEHVFVPDSTNDFLQKLRDWGKKRLGIVNVSAPQVRLYVKGCSRELVRDDVNAPWHYLLSLTRGNQRCQVKILAENKSTNSQPARVRIDRMVDLELRFNDLAVHQAIWPYAIKGGNNSMNPLEAIVLLDGYLW